LYAAIRGYALSYLSSCAGRIRFLLGTPGMVALDLDVGLKGLFQQIVQHLENIPKPQGENISAITCDLSVRCLCKSRSTFVRVDITYQRASEVSKIILTCDFLLKKKLIK
jgi:enamine deaminase RidA (YjgF/YER057c/UK114 family)